jgi:hypothetical protein
MNQITQGLALSICIATAACGSPTPVAAPSTSALATAPSARPFEGHFVDGCVSVESSCFELWLERDGDEIRGWHAAQTRRANKIDGGDYYEEGRDAPASVQGEVNGDRATVTLVSTHDGAPVTATLTVNGLALEWDGANRDHPVLPVKARLQRK